MLENELQTFEQQKHRLLAEAEGKYVLIHQAEVAGVFESRVDAIRAGRLRFGKAPILVKQIVAIERPYLVSTPILLMPLGTGVSGENFGDQDGEPVDGRADHPPRTGS